MSISDHTAHEAINICSQHLQQPKTFIRDASKLCSFKYKKAMLLQGNRAILQLFFSV